MIGCIYCCGWYHLNIPVDSTNWNQWVVNNNKKDGMKVGGENVEEIKEERV